MLAGAELQQLGAICSAPLILKGPGGHPLESLGCGGAGEGGVARRHHDDTTLRHTIAFYRTCMGRACCCTMVNRCNT